MPSSTRLHKVADLIKREIVAILAREINDPRLQQVTISDVEMAPDLGTAHVYFSMPDETRVKEVTKALMRAVGFIRKNIAKRVDLRYVPNIQFHYDESIRRGEHLSGLINQLCPDEETED